MARTSPATSRKSLAGIALRTAVALAAIVFLARGLRWSDIVGGLRATNPWLLAGVVGLNALMMAVKAVRFRMLLGSHRTSFRSCFLMLLTSSALNNVTPFRGGDVARLWMLKRGAQVTKSAAVAIALVEKVFELLALSAIVIGAMLLFPDAGQRWARFAAPALFTASAALLIAARASTGPERPFARARVPERNGRGRLRTWLRATGDQLSIGARVLRDGDVTARAMALSLLAWGCELMMIGLCARALDLSIAVAIGPMVLLGVNLAIAIPAAPASVGPFEGAMVAVLIAAGVAKGPAVAFAILYHATLVIPVTVAGLAVILWLGVGSVGGRNLSAAALADRPQGRQPV